MDQEELDALIARKPTIKRQEYSLFVSAFRIRHQKIRIAETPQAILSAIWCTINAESICAYNQSMVVSVRYLSIRLNTQPEGIRLDSPTSSEITQGEGNQNIYLPQRSVNPERDQGSMKN
ncbi:hypothetical protein AYI70_g11079 [Smittium culicis]|uniref:Uncharacterized protein n=1 Tax=Smittium culicis TaxID=133412 RepID=A0A1R1X3H1_9FUNG|nr:hypothetical protein AYI70_g11079 [Smittium culicis]